MRKHLLASVPVLATLMCLFVLAAKPAEKPVPPSREKAEMMGRVEDFFMHNFRDITSRKSREWADVTTDDKGNRSIRYMYDAAIWDKEQKIMNQIFTFDAKGYFVSYKNVEGFPKAKTDKAVDLSTTDGVKEQVELFFSRNYRDITARKSLEWGQPEKQANGNVSIRYKYIATIWGKDKIICNKIFTFDPEGHFVSVADVK
jgi:hypothetical protein